jgi:hypothetical protein
MDAAALLATFFTTGPSGTFVASSPALAGELSGLERRDTFPLDWRGINWMAAPGSRYKQLRKLFCDQRLHIASGRVESDPWTIEPHGSPDAAAASFAKHLVQAAGAMASRYGTIHLALTGGLDTRTFLAAFLAAGVKFKVVTQAFPGVDLADVKTASEICRRLGLDHNVVEPLPASQQRLDDWLRHTGGSVQDADAHHLIPGDQYRFLAAGDLLVRGNCVEICRRWYDFKFRRIRHRLNGQAIWAAFDGRPPDPWFAATLDEWIAWRTAHPNGLDLVENFYLDQRVGGWVAAAEQGLDMLDGCSLQAINSLAFYSDLMSASNHGRRTGEIQKRGIRLLAPALLDFPLNPAGLNYRKRVKFMLKKLFRARMALMEILQ